MAVKPDRYVEVRKDGTDPVGSFSARRISEEMRQWVADEATRMNISQRAVLEDVIEAFIKHRKMNGGKFQYENLPRTKEKTFRMFIRVDLLEDALNLVEDDKIFNGDLVNAAIKYDISKNGKQL